LNFRTPGGSSGGEGALFAAGGTPFGTGSDLAGSLRIPAAFCGFITLKPTQDRLVVTNTHPGIPGRSRYGLSFGFFTNTVTEQIELLKLFLGNSCYRQLVPTSIPFPLNEETVRQTGRLRIGYFDSDGFCPPVPCIRRGVLETVKRLKLEGHDLVRFTVPNVDEMVQLLYKLLMPDGGHYIRALYENDAIDPYMKDFVMLLKVPRIVRWLASFVLRPISPQLSAICSAYISNLDDLRYTNERCDVYKKEFIAYWKSLELDALICPSFPVPAVPHRFPSKMSMAVTYTALFNLLDFPAGVVPVGKVTVKDDEDLVNESTYPVGHNVALRIIRDSSINSVGLPLSVQIVTLPFEEEKCLRVMRDVQGVWSDDYLSKNQIYPTDR
uniref:Amidase domain-containing protein n=1 Tax=Angiostrongylus costaricensis TaxID=334426 RepID=A0A0R3PIH5_ANGCS